MHSSQIQSRQELQHAGGPVLRAERCGGCSGVQLYGFGFSKEFIGQFMRETGVKPTIATKFAPLPWRFTQCSVV